MLRGMPERVMNMNKKIRWLSLILACLFLVLPLASCDGDGGDDVDAGGIGEDGSVNWDEVDFKGSTMKHAISVDLKSGGTFPTVERYLRGMEGASTDEVIKKVIQRNAQVENALNMKVEYEEMDARDIFDDIEARVLGSDSEAPDLYTNDMKALRFAVVAGLLTNVANPTDKDGNPLDSYFDFTDDGWKYDYMNEMTLNKQKVYLLAGTYHLDMVRMAQVLFVNKTMFNQNAKSLGAGSIEGFYEYVLDGIWDYEMLTDMCKKIWQDNGSSKNRVDKDDGRIGLCISHTVYYHFLPATGISTYYMGEDGLPKVIEDYNELHLMGTEARTIWSQSGAGEGIYFERDFDTANAFMSGQYLFAPVMLGELESEEMRDIAFEKGLVPMPKYDASRQDEYYTMVDSSAEFTCILLNAPSFAKASAYMQYVNELSEPVLTEYYEFSLKFKYNEDPAIRSMIDLVYDRISSPFGMYFEEVIFQYLDVDNSRNLNLHYAISTNGVSAFYDEWNGPWRRALDKALEDFAKVN